MSQKNKKKRGKTADEEHWALLVGPDVMGRGGGVGPFETQIGPTCTAPVSRTLGYLVSSAKLYHSSYQIFVHMYKILNIDYL